MAMRRPKLLLLLITTIFVLLIHGQGFAPINGEWSPIKNVKDPYVQEIGNYSVTEHNKAANTSLDFQKVLSGETMLVHGINYRLIVSVKDGAQLSQYQALVWDKASLKFRHLISFKRIN